MNHSLVMAKGLVWLNEAEPYLEVPPRWVSHSEEFWQMWSIGGRNGNPLHAWIAWKGKKIWYWKMSLVSSGIQYATGEDWRAITNSSRKNGAAGPKQKWHAVVNVSSGESKVLCREEQYCTATRNVKFMNQVLEVVKQDMARLNINILGISELKWMGMGDFNSADHCINHCRQEWNEIALIVNKRVLKCST